MLTIEFKSAGEVHSFVETIDEEKVKQSIYVNKDVEEVQDYFRIWPDDRFLSVHYQGTIADLASSLAFLHFPRKCYGKMVSVQGYSGFTMSDLMVIERAFSGAFDEEQDEALLVWRSEKEQNEVDIVMLTKVYEPNHTTSDLRFESLWDAVIQEMDKQSFSILYDSLQSARWHISEGRLELDVCGDEVDREVLAIKKHELERLIYEYSGSALQVMVV